MKISSKLQAAYEELCSPPSDADASWNRARGYQFERVLSDLLSEDGLEPRTSYKLQGEQIDGSFFLEGTVFLLEAKWHADPIPASTLYEFKGKVDGKLAGTLGVFISMSGYSKDAVNALTLGKSLNLILFDKRDMDAAIGRSIGFKEVLKRKLRKAAEEGAVYFPTEADVVSTGSSGRVEIDQLEPVLGHRFSFAPVGTGDSDDLVVICEADSDRELISAFARRILSGSGSRRTIKIVAAGGKHAIPRVANAMHTSVNAAQDFLIVVDGDGDREQTREMLERGIGFSGWRAAIPDPAIENWLGLDRKALRGSRKDRFLQSLGALEALDLDELRLRDASFSAFYDAILRA